MTELEDWNLKCLHTNSWVLWSFWGFYPWRASWNTRIQSGNKAWPSGAHTLVCEDQSPVFSLLYLLSVANYKKVWNSATIFKTLIFRLKSNIHFKLKSLVEKDTILKKSGFLSRNIPYTSWTFLNNNGPETTISILLLI